MTPQTLSINEAAGNSSVSFAVATEAGIISVKPGKPITTTNSEVIAYGVAHKKLVVTAAPAPEIKDEKPAKTPKNTETKTGEDATGGEQS